METDSGNQERHLASEAAVTSGTPQRNAATRAQRLARVAAAGHLFDFFKLVHLLEQLHDHDSGKRSEPGLLGRSIRFRPDTSVVFPATDVKRVEIDSADPDRVTVVLSFLGLYGFDSPMPAYFHRDIALGLRTARPLRDFLDIFNHRIYTFFYLSWKKYRAQLSITDESTDSNSRRYMAVGGIGTKGGLAGVRVSPLRVAAFAGQLGARLRNVDGLRNLIEGCMPGYRPIVEENVPRWVTLAERPRLGTGNGVTASLGGFATIGERSFDVAGKFRVVLGPLGLRQFQDCLPGEVAARTLQSLVNLYVTDLLDYDLELRLRTSEVPPTRLGDRSRKLGFSTWLRRPAGEFTSRIVNYGTDT